MKKSEIIAFIGQGVVGKAIADDFETRGYKTIRYSLEPEYSGNKHLVSEANIVFISVPTPTKKGVHDISHVQEALGLVGKNSIAVIKSTILPGTTDILQENFPDIYVTHSPEFLSVASAKEDAKRPFINVLGLPRVKISVPERKIIAEKIISVLPKADNIVCDAVEAETIKYSHNIHGYMQVVFWNIMHDYASSFGSNWETVRKAMIADPMVSNQYLNPIHKSGRGAGGHCFVKDFSSFKNHFAKTLRKDKTAQKLLDLTEKKNLELLKSTGKDQDLVTQVYGKTKNKASKKRAKK